MLNIKKTAYTEIYLAIIMILTSSCCAICPTCCSTSSITTNKQETILVKNATPDSAVSITSHPINQETSNANETD